MFEYKGLKAFYGVQVFFSTKLVQPLFEELDSAFGLSFCAQIEQNVAKLQGLILTAAE